VLLIPPFEQFIAGLAASLFVCGVLRWTPIPRELLIALAVGVTINLLFEGRPQSLGGHDFTTISLVQGLVGYPYFNLGVAIVITVALFVTSRRS
jgi:hypothetical protein